MPNKGKIASLPAEIRDIIEAMIDAGNTEEQCAKYLNEEIKRSEPDLDEITKDGPITQQNVHNWKHSEYKARKIAKEIGKNFEQQIDEDDRNKHLQKILGWLTAKIAAEILQLDADPPEPEQYATRLHQLVADAAILRKLANEDRWLRAEERRVTTGEARFTLASKIEAQKAEQRRRDAISDETDKDTGELYKKITPILRDGIVKTFEEINEPGPTELEQFGAGLTQEQADKLATILSEDQMDKLGWPVQPEEEQA